MFHFEQWNALLEWNGNLYQPEKEYDMELKEDPLWYKDAIIYELHVKTFFDSNGDGIGDFPGLISKLDYLQELGVNTLWLMPFYPSPGRDDGYDISDYHNVHPAVGQMADFRRFIEEAHQRGLRVITELVINHTSDQHPWFQAARRAPPGSIKRDYYVWSDSDLRYSGTRIIFSDTEKSNWAWDDEAQAYYWHRFFSHQPDLNFANPHVFNAIMHVMRFWLDAGVDGMRLDAMPYLCEREGTSNENLPETHAVIRRMRSEMDKHYRNRMFLAEANQWPEDVREYFGDGDECHMAYHFPLMPRMYMSIAQEDRHPMVEIMEQTPDIPANCQWGVFLRNHDELTLEMVTDRERDYLYHTYAIDPDARLNLGICRRLAPLLDNDRHRVELMNLLLMTMPGSPILYYGDEIGMGDNFLLGDRNGVRTPMQWNSGPNGGFSTADPGRLFLPPVTDPVYGFGAINVESQQRNAFSLLNWMRRAVAVRKAHPAFGRGTLRFLRPGNRKILAYLREHEDEIILCVANLSRAPQAVELDLGLFKGRVPVELLGRSRFPPIGDLPYLLTLSGHGFYAFRLAADVEAPDWHEERPATPDLPVLVLVGTGWRTVFSPMQDGEPVNQLMVRRAREQMERQIIPRFFRSQTWFLDKEAEVEKFEFDQMSEWPSESGSWLLATVRVMLAGGGTHRYALPLALAWEDESERDIAALLAATLAKVRRRARTGILFDAFWDDTFCRAIVSGMEQGAELPFGQGMLKFRATSAFCGFSQDAETDVTHIITGRGRLAVNLGDQFVLKTYRWMLPGMHPELEISRFLTETAKFGHIAQLAGTVEYSDSTEHESTLAILESYGKNQGNAWAYTLSYLERFLDECLARPERQEHSERPQQVEHTPAARHAAYISLIKTLGLRTAQFHQALALADAPLASVPAAPVPASVTGAFGHEPVTMDDIDEWINSTRTELDTMYELLEAELPRLSDALQAVGISLAAARPRLYRRVARMAISLSDPVQAKARCHGDYHLGQVWLSSNDFLITNYGGGPGLTWTERRRKHSALRDVAGMLFSFSQAAAAALDEVTADSPESATMLRHHAEEWHALAVRHFFRSYRKAMAGSGLLPSGQHGAEAQVMLFMTGKAATSLSSALAQRSKTVAPLMQELIRLSRLSPPRR